MTIASFRDLIVWQKAVYFAKEIYKATESFPKSELFGLTSQIRRAGVSVPSNIAEGRYRGTRKDFLQFLRISYGSCAELNTQLLIAKELHFLNEKDYNELVKALEEISKMLNSMIRKLGS